MILTYEKFERLVKALDSHYDGRYNRKTILKMIFRHYVKESSFVCENIRTERLLFKDYADKEKNRLEFGKFCRFITLTSNKYQNNAKKKQSRKHGGSIHSHADSKE